MVNIITNRRGTTRKEMKSPGRKVPHIIRPPKPFGPITSRGVRGRSQKVEWTDGPGEAPPKLGALITLPEWYVYWYLWKRKKMEPNQDFIFQSSLEGGRQELGGLVTDFELPGRIGARGLIINVQGEYWHRFRQSNRAKDLLDKIRLVGMGFHVVYANEDDIIRGVGYVVERALEGVQLFSDQEFG